MSFDRTPNKRSMIIGPGRPIMIDSVNSETHTSVVRFTRYPVESGRLLSDHAQDQPEEVEMGILVTDTPMQDGEPVFEGRHRAIYAQLKLWQKLHSKIIIILGLRSYINMYLEELVALKQPTDGKSIRLNLKFVEIPETQQSLAALVGQLLVDSSVAHTATEVLPIGII